MTIREVSGSTRTCLADRHYPSAAQSPAQGRRGELPLTAQAAIVQEVVSQEAGPDLEAVPPVRAPGTLLADAAAVRLWTTARVASGSAKKGRMDRNLALADLPLAAPPQQEATTLVEPQVVVARASLALAA